jgi:prophage tail gpP-like protein
MSNRLELRIGGDVWTGWKSVAVTMSLEEVASKFSIVTRSRDPWALRAGAAAEISLDRTLVLRGFVDRVTPSFDDNGALCSIEGRARTGDLVDCAADTVPGEWWSVRLQDLVSEIAKPFGIDVVDAVGEVERFLMFRVQPGEAAFDAIERACRMRAVLATCTAGGDLLLTRPDQVMSGVELREGFNVKACAAAEDWSERFFEYLVRGQTFGTDENFGPPAAQIEGRAIDPAVRSSRRLIITPEGTVSPLAAQQRAMWEATVRKARSLKVSVTTSGWIHHEGALWRPNLRVEAELPSIRIAGPMLVGSVHLAQGEEGSTAQLELLQPDSFVPQPDLETAGNPFADLVAQESDE